MANSYFQFKQFTINQSDCAMKVCTDSCLFGALLPINNLSGKVIKAALDIGTGTGLLSLQYAQVNNEASINAIEIEPNAAQQAKENIAASIFSENVQVYEIDIFNFPESKQYDLIFCNPPFYNNDLKSEDEAKNIAHHSITFSFDKLMMKAKKLLNKDGILAILLPTEKIIFFENIFITNNWFIAKKIVLHQNEKQHKFRTIYFLALTKVTYTKKIIMIKKDNEYTEEFIDYLNPFYLKL